MEPIVGNSNQGGWEVLAPSCVITYIQMHFGLEGVEVILWINRPIVREVSGELHFCCLYCEDVFGQWEVRRESDFSYLRGSSRFFSSTMMGLFPPAFLALRLLISHLRSLSLSSTSFFFPNLSRIDFFSSGPHGP